MFGNSMLIGGSSEPRILDLYPNATHGYSLRKLHGAYTGSAIRVSSSSVVADIGFDSNGDLDVAALAAWEAVNGTAHIVIWYDQVGNNNLTASYGDAPITTSSTVENGKRVIFFRYANADIMAFDSTFNLTSTFDIFATSKKIGTGAGVIIARTSGTSGQVEGLMASYTDNSTYRLTGDSPNNSHVASDSSTSWNTYNWNRSSMSRDNVELTATTTSVTTTPGVQSVGRYRNLNYSNCHTSEIIIYRVDKSVERSNITQNIMTYWGTE